MTLLNDVILMTS